MTTTRTSATSRRGRSADHLPVVRISRELLDDLVAHAREDAPNECCGMVATHDGEAVKVFRARNVHASPLRYEVHPKDQLRAMLEIDDEGWELGAIYHSHTRSDPVPSQTDVNLASNWPDPLYVIVGIAGEDPDVRAWAIRDGDVAPARLEIEG
jgi:[CysO sulfur-carrier protein]-S-L-cysteine hydrolase